MAEIGPFNWLLGKGVRAGLAVNLPISPNDPATTRSDLHRPSINGLGVQIPAFGSLSVGATLDRLKWAI